MNKNDFPKEVTQKNVATLLNRGLEIHEEMTKWARKEGWRGFLVYVLLDIMSFVALSLVIFVAFLIIIGVILEVINSIIVLDFLPIPSPYSLIIALLLEISSFYLALHLKGYLARLISYRVLHIPQPEFEVFGESSFIAKNLFASNRRLAKTKIRPFLNALGRYLNKNRDLKGYLSPEIGGIRNGYLLRRLILYSNKAEELAYIFLNIGLSFIHEDFPKIYSIIRDLRSKMEEVKVEGKAETIVSFVERYMEPIKNLIYIALLVISLAIWLLAGFTPLIFP